MPLTKQDVIEALRGVRLPGAEADVVSSGPLKRAASCDGFVGVTIACELDGAARESAKRDVSGAILRAAERDGDRVAQIQCEFVDASGRVVESGVIGGEGAGAGSQRRATEVKGSGAPPGVETPQSKASAKAGVAHVIAVGAGKGGVGKSTISVNLAVGLARRGHAVGLMDGDIYGPSAPTLMGLHDLETATVGNMLQPFLVHGVKTMTIGKLVEEERPLIWRGPMAHGAFKQLIDQTQWGELDYLVIDLPPGTGDVSLTLAQSLSLDGAVIVCTPQRVAQDDAVRAARMFEQLGIEVLGVVENMSYFIGDDGKEYDIFGRGGAQQMAQRLGLAYLGGVPINMALRANSDAGDPTANFEGDDALARSLNAMIDMVESQVTLASMRKGARTPSLTIR